MLRVGSLACVALVAGGLAWSVSAAPVGLAAAAEAQRAVPLGRMRAPAPAALGTARVTVALDGLKLAVPAVTEQPVQTLLRSLGIAPAASDRVSVPLDAAVLPGMLIGLDRGIPVTLVDGGRAVELRAQRETVGALVSSLGIALGPLDRLAPEPDTLVGPGAVVRIVRVSEGEVTERVEVPFAVRRVSDPSLTVGTERVLTPGEPGEALRKFAVRTVDGVEAERTLLSETEESEPVTEVRAVGSRPRPVPPAPGEIASIVRAAADRWGADPDTLLRVAWCESRYNPSAYNYASGASGLFQFMPATFARNSARAGFGDASIWDPVASANTAAMLFASGQSGQWACK